MKTYKTVIITSVSTIVLLGVVGAFFGAKMAVKTEKPTEVRIEKPIRGSLTELINAPGELKPKKKVELSAKVSSRILELPFKEGDIVTKGNPLANPPVGPSVVIRLDDKDLKAALRSAQARRSAQASQIKVAQIEIETKNNSIDECKAAVEQDVKNLARQKTLLESRDISQSVFDEAKSKADQSQARLAGLINSLQSAQQALEVAKHNLDAADAEVEQMQEGLSYTVITSPIDGIITKINAEVGELVMTGTMNNAGTIIMEIADLSQMIFETQVDESNIGRVKLDQPARIRLQAWPDVEFTGRVSQIDLVFTNNARTGSKYYQTDITLDPDSRLTFSGMTGDADIETVTHDNILKLPSQAVLSINTDQLPAKIRESSPEVNVTKSFTTVVYRAVDDKSLVTPVKIGPSDVANTIIVAGLNDDDVVITGPYKVLEKIKNDQKIIDEKLAKKDNNKNSDAKTDNKPDQEPPPPPPQ